MKPPALLLVLGPAFVARLLAAEGGPVRPAPTAPPPPAPEVLALGERVFKADCATCHVPGKAGSPRVGHPSDWAKRLPRGRDLLLKHALDGYSGPEGDEMPARGGNDDLTDAEVAAAVDHILRLVQPVPSASPVQP